MNATDIKQTSEAQAVRINALALISITAALITGCGQTDPQAPKPATSGDTPAAQSAASLPFVQAKPYQATESDEFLKLFQGRDIAGIETVVEELNSNEPAWRREANERIDKIRKTDLKLQVVDGDGEPVAGVPVRIRLRKHDFDFGAVVSAYALLNPDNLPKFRQAQIKEQNYRFDREERFRVLGQFANHVGFANALKYKISGPKGNAGLIQNVIPRLRKMGLSLRGHALMWPGWGNMSTDAAKLKNDIAKLRARCEKEVIEYAKLWDVDEWDVVNETRGKQDVQKILGKEVLVDWFKLAEKHMRNQGGHLYLNENRVVSFPNERQAHHLKLFHDEAKFLLDNGAPLTALGLQSRFRTRVAPNEIYDRLEKLSDLNLPIKGTEFEIIMDNLSPEEHARYTAEIMTIYFSHRLVNGITAWTFFSKDKNDAGKALINANGVKPNGKLWLHLKNRLWNTDETLTTDTDGFVSVHGFLGDYEVMVGAGKQTRRATFSLAHDTPGYQIRTE